MIKSQIFFLKDVLEINGEFKPNIYQRLVHKGHYFRDLTMIRKVLAKYSEILHQPLNIDLTFEPTIPLSIKSKIYYKCLISQKKLPPKSLNKWLIEFPNFDFSTFYRQKLCHMHVIKVKEFLFKVIHHICYL